MTAQATIVVRRTIALICPIRLRVTCILSNEHEKRVFTGGLRNLWMYYRPEPGVCGEILEEYRVKLDESLEILGEFHFVPRAFWRYWTRFS